MFNKNYYLQLTKRKKNCSGTDVLDILMNNFVYFNGFHVSIYKSYLGSKLVYGEKDLFYSKLYIYPA